MPEKRSIQEILGVPLTIIGTYVTEDGSQLARQLEIP